MRLTVLGCSGSFPGPTSPASGYLVEAEDDTGRTWRLVLDLGNGALGPLQRHAPLRAVDAILLSHLHADHCLDLCGYYVFLKYQPSRDERTPIPVHAPTGAADRLARAYDLDPDPGMTGEFTFVTWAPGRPVRVGPFTVTPSPVLHPVEAYAMRVEGPGEDGGRVTLTYTGDTDTCAGVLEAARGADLLLAEAAFEEGRDADRGIHLTGLRAGELARDAGAGRLLLTHLPAWNDPGKALDDARLAFAGPVDLAAPDAVHVV
ncbi:MBL fold metallo-hydrolase [Thalassiella azotivora]